MKGRVLLLLICFVLWQNAANAQSWKQFNPGVGSNGSFLTITADNNNIIYAAFRNVGSGGSNPSKSLEVRKFNGTDWSTIGTIGGSDPYSISMAFDKNDTPYVCYYKVSNATYVRKYNGSGWTNLGTNVVSGNNTNPYLTIDTAGTPYVAYGDVANSGQPVVKKYNSSTNSWSALAAISTHNCSPIKLVVNKSNNELYAVYRDNSQGSEGVYAKKYNSSNNTWSSVGSRISYAQAVNELSAVFDNLNTLYVAYGDNTITGSAGLAVVAKYNGSSWVNVGATRFSSGYADGLSLAVNSSNQLHVSYIDQGNSYSPTVKRYNGSSWVNVGVQNFVTAANASEYNTLVFDEYDNVYTAYNRTTTAIEVARYREGPTVWKGSGTGGTSAPYYWDKGEPDDITDATITAAGTVSGFTCNNLTINSNLVIGTGETVTVDGNLTNNTNSIQGDASIILDNGDTAFINGSTPLFEPRMLVNSGTTLFMNSGSSLNVDSTLELKGDLVMHDSADLTFNTGKLLLSGNTAQTLNLGQTTHKYLTIDTMELKNGAGASFGYGVVYIKSEYQPTSGTLASSNRLRLLSDSSGTARIAKGSTSGGYITGNIVGRLYIPGGRRAFRFLSHAAIDTKPLDQLTDNIDITGQGGSANGFTTTTSNNPSAFYFDVTTADNSTAGNNPGWQACTDATTTTWAKGQVLRVLIRGSKGEGLTNSSYTPSAVTLDMYEQVNQGNQTLTLTKGTNTNFVLVGNPFPSQVDLSTVARGSSVGSNFYIWDPNQGVKGGYTSHMFSSSYVLPQWGGFVTTVSANSNNTMVFEEADKVGSTPAAQFKGTGNGSVLELSIDDTAYHWDRLLISFDQDGYAVQDKLDAVKLNNPGLDFYTVSKDGTDLSIDVRPMQDKDIIPVGVDVWHYGGSGTFTITAKQLSLPNGSKLTFYDKYLNTQQVITDTFSYTFSVNSADSMSGGKNRFQIGVADQQTNVSNATQTGISEQQMQMYPNPVNGLLHVAYKGVEGKSTVMVYDAAGRVIYMADNYSPDGNGLVEINVNDMAPGVYVTELKTETGRIIQRFVKN